MSTVLPLSLANRASCTVYTQWAYHNRGSRRVQITGRYFSCHFS